MLRLARPVFLVCLLTLLLALVGSVDTMWRYIGYPLTSSLLPLMGIALGLICVLGKDLDSKFKRMALIVAVLTLLAGLLAPVFLDAHVRL